MSDTVPKEPRPRGFARLWVAVSLGVTLSIGVVVLCIAQWHVTSALEKELVVHLETAARAARETIERNLKVRQRVESDIAEHPLLVNSVMQSQDGALIARVIDHLGLARVLGERPRFSLFDFSGEEIVNPHGVQMRFDADELHRVLDGRSAVESRFAVDDRGLLLQRLLPLRYGGAGIEGALLLETHPELESLMPAYAPVGEVEIVVSVGGDILIGGEHHGDAHPHAHMEAPDLHFFGLDIAIQASRQRLEALQREVASQIALALLGASLLLGGVAWWIGQRMLVLPHEQTLDLVRELDEARTSAEAAAQSKMRFLANMSHELRTPFNGILGHLELLGGSRLDPEQRELQSVAAESATSLLQIIDDILDLARIEEGRMPLARSEVDVVELVEGVVNWVEHSATRKGLSVEVEADRDFPRFIETDPLRVRQILLNLLGNAIKFTGEGSVVVSLRRTHAHLELAVEDTGVGIEESRLASIFEAFEQADGGTARTYGGTGLGLAISQSLAHLLDGEIDAQSVRGHGSKFRLRLPVDAIRRDGEFAFGSPAVAAAPEATANAAKKRSKLDLHVLVAEDNATNQLLVRKQLEGLGCEVEIAPNGRVALEVARAGHFDLILMDLQMPEMDGVAACAALRASGCSLPIIALTANVMQEDRDRCFEAGMDGFLAKPFLLDELEKVLVAFGGPGAEGAAD